MKIECAHCHRKMNASRVDLAILLTPWPEPRGIICSFCGVENRLPNLSRVIVFSLKYVALIGLVICGNFMLENFKFEIHGFLFSVVPPNWIDFVFNSLVALLVVLAFLTCTLLSIGLTWLYFNVGFGLKAQYVRSP
jgi:hypothetical protein